MSKKEKTQRLQSNRSARLKNVYVKAKLADIYNIDKFADIQRKVLDNLGCTACTSGINVVPRIENMIDATNTRAIGEIADKSIKSRLTKVRVVAPTSLVNNFEGNLAARKSILEQLGCPSCTSGYDIRFETELGYALDGAANVISQRG